MIFVNQVTALLHFYIISTIFTVFWNYVCFFCREIQAHQRIKIAYVKYKTIYFYSCYIIAHLRDSMFIILISLCDSTPSTAMCFNMNKIRKEEQSYQPTTYRLSRTLHHWEKVQTSNSTTETKQTSEWYWMVFILIMILVLLYSVIN